MNDRVFFSPGPLALGKGFAYLLAFFTTVYISDVNEQTYLAGIIIFSFGCICDYYEVAYSREKNKIVKGTSLVLALMISMLVVVGFAIAIKYNKDGVIESFIRLHSTYVNCFLFIYCIIPLVNGSWLMFKDVVNDEKAPLKLDQKVVSGFSIKP